MNLARHNIAADLDNIAAAVVDIAVDKLAAAVVDIASADIAAAVVYIAAGYHLERMCHIALHHCYLHIASK